MKIGYRENLVVIVKWCYRGRFVIERYDIIRKNYLLSMKNCYEDPWLLSSSVLPSSTVLCSFECVDSAS